MKAGQIAHLDRNSSNDAEDNLAFLCLDHHDEYDSRTSQRKGLVLAEVKQFRTELDQAIGKAFSVTVHFGESSVPPDDPYAGQYIKLEGVNDSAEIVVTPLPDGISSSPRYAVTGFALWGIGREYGPNMGELSFVGELDEGELVHGEQSYPGALPYSILLRFDGRSLTVEEVGTGPYGLNVSFAGKYRRA